MPLYYGQLFELPDHCAVAPGQCKCGKGFPDSLALDEHILGPELAHAHHRDVAAALDAIHAKAAEMAADGGICVNGCTPRPRRHTGEAGGVS